MRNPGGRINQVDDVGFQQMHAVASQIGERADEVRRQLALHGEVPLLNIGVLAVALLGIGREGSGAGEIRADWISQLQARGTFRRVGGHFVLGGQILIVQLAVFVVGSESGVNHGLAVFARRPGDADARIEITVVLLAEARAHAAESLLRRRYRNRRGWPVRWPR